MAEVIKFFRWIKCNDSDCNNNTDSNNLSDDEGNKYDDEMIIKQQNYDDSNDNE